MGFDSILRNRTERIQPYMQRDERQLHALIAQCEQQLRREVQPRGRRRGATWRARVNGLVALRVIQRPVNVRRQRHLPDTIQIRRDGFREDQRALAALAGLDDLRKERNRSLALHQLQATAHPRPRAAHQRAPPILAQVPQEQQLHFAAARQLAPEQARRNDAALVGDQQVAGAQICANLTEDTVLQRARIAVHDQEPRAIARLYRLLRNQSLRQLVV